MMRENELSEKIKNFAKRKGDSFTNWFIEKEHPRSRLNKNVFFHDLLKIIGLILVFLIVYSNIDKLNQIVLIFIKIGSLLQLVLLFFILKKAWHLFTNLKYSFRGLNNGIKALIAIAIVLLILFVFLNQDGVVNSITQTYEDTNFSKLNPIKISSNFSLGNFSLSNANGNKSSNSLLINNDIQPPIKIDVNKYDFWGLYRCSILESQGTSAKKTQCRLLCGYENMAYSSYKCVKDKLECYCLE